MEAIAELMMEPKLTEYKSSIHVAYSPNAFNGDESFSEINSGYWWKNNEQMLKGRLGPDHHLLPVIIYLDATSLDVTNKHSATPVCTSLGNFSRSLRVGLRITTYLNVLLLIMYY